VPAARLYHLDALRSFCMLFGLFVHGATLGDTPLFTAIKEASDLFRMAAFFLVSGYFTTLVCRRSSASGYARNRLLLIGVPLATALLLIVPWTWWLIDTWHNRPMGFREWLGGGHREMTQGNGVWHLQFWFLFSLAAYALLTPALLALLGRPALAAGLDRLLARAGPFALPAVALALAVAVMLLLAVLDRLVAPLVAETPFAFIVRATLNYFPWFALGVAAFTNARLFAVLHRASLAGLIVCGAALLALALWGDALPRTPERILYWIVRPAFMLFLVAALLALAERVVTGPSRLLSWTTASAYSFYLLHMSFIYVLAHLLRPAIGNVELLFAVIVATGLPFLVWLHVAVIAKSPLLLLLLNGRPLARPVPSRA
jgi:glucan biosynthesis protein C